MEEWQEGMALGLKKVDAGGQAVARARAPSLESAGPADALLQGNRLGEPCALSVVARRGGGAGGGRPAVAGEGRAAQGVGAGGRRLRGGRRVAVAGRGGPRRSGWTSRSSVAGAGEGRAGSPVCRVR